MSGIFRVHKVAWPRLHGVRRDGGKLKVAWEPDETMAIGSFDRDIIPNNPDASDESPAATTAKRVGAIMMRLRELALAAGDPGITPAARLGSGTFMGVGYLIIVLATWWYFARP